MLILIGVIDVFRSKGSVLVDYIVQLDTQAKQFDTQQLKSMFHDSLGHPFEKSAALEAEESSNDISRPRALQLGKFEIDPDFTDFIGECVVLYNTSLLWQSVMALFACEDHFQYIATA